MSALEEYNASSVLGLPYGEYVRKPLADAMRDELLAEVGRLKEQVERLVKAHNDMFNNWETASGEAYRAEAELAALKAENERLRCCGNCKWFRAEDYQNCGHPDVSIDEQGEYYISAPDKCDFTPSRWTAREDKP